MATHSPFPSAPIKSRILVVDDHPIVRSGLIRLIDLQEDLVCCGEASNAAEATACIAAKDPDLVILDLRLKGTDSLELIKELIFRFDRLRILVLSQYDTPIYVERALRAGARGYVLKDQAADDLLEAMRAVLTGEVYLSRAMAASLLHKMVRISKKASREGLDLLTDRELHVLRLLGSGRSTRAIAGELNLSFKTIESHRENIKLKLGLRDAAQLVHFATEWSSERICVAQ